MQAPSGVAAHRQPRRVDLELRQAQVEPWNGRPRHAQIDARQVEDDVVVHAIAQAEAANRKLRVPAVPARDDLVDLDGLADARTEPPRDVRMTRLELRIDDDTDAQEQREDDAESGDRQLRGEPHEATRPSRRPRGGRHNGREMMRERL